MDTLIARIKERVANPMRAVNAAEWVRPIPTIRPPVLAAELDAAESALGFALPLLVRALYTEVGNGGWGPGYGLLRLTGDGSLIEETLWHMECSPARPGEPGWPTGVVRLVEWGCHLASCVDCLHPACPVLYYDNDVAIRDGVSPPDYLYPEAESLAGWLSEWLDGVDLVAVHRRLKKHAEPTAEADGPA